MRLLVIEDDSTLRESLVRKLTEGGFAVEQAADGKEGLYFASEYPIDLAIIDLGLPELSGLEIIKQVRADGHTYPILILTARDRWEDKVDGLSAGADDYVVKPFHFEEVECARQCTVAPQWRLGILCAARGSGDAGHVAAGGAGQRSGNRSHEFRVQNHGIPHDACRAGDFQSRVD